MSFSKLTLSPHKKKLKVDPRDTDTGEVVEIVYASPGGEESWKFLYEVDYNLKITHVKKKVKCGLYVGDRILERNGKDYRGKTRVDLMIETEKEKKYDKITLLVLRVNSPQPERYLTKGFNVCTSTKVCNSYFDIIFILIFSIQGQPSGKHTVGSVESGLFLCLKRRQMNISITVKSVDIILDHLKNLNMKKHLSECLKVTKMIWIVLEI